MTSYMEFLQIISIGLLRYFQVYAKIKEDDNKDKQVVIHLSNEIDMELKRRFPYLKETIDSVTLFETPYEVTCFDMNIKPDEILSFGNEYIELLVKFISLKKSVDYSYHVLELNVIPFDGLTITHGMIVGYFAPFY